MLAQISMQSSMDWGIVFHVGIAIHVTRRVNPLQRVIEDITVAVEPLRILQISQCFRRP